MVTGHRGFVGTAFHQCVQAMAPGVLAWCPPPEGFDLRDEDSIRRAVAQRPDWIVHLAAQSHVPTAWADPAGTLQVNAGGTASLLKALAEAQFKGRLLFVSSADVYGTVPESQLPVTEDRAVAPRNPYASSKVAGEVLCQQWARTHVLDIVIARPFNHTGPGQRGDFALPSFARDIGAIARGERSARILTGDLDVTRDFLDVRDVVAAYLALLENGRAGETYNVCSGREVRLRDALDMLLEIAGVRAEVATDPARLRPAEQRRMCGSHTRLTQATGWHPRIDWRDTLQALTEHWKLEPST